MEESKGLRVVLYSALVLFICLLVVALLHKEDSTEAIEGVLRIATRADLSRSRHTVSLETESGTYLLQFSEDTEFVNIPVKRARMTWYVGERYRAHGLVNEGKLMKVDVIEYLGLPIEEPGFVNQPLDISSAGRGSRQRPG